MELALLLEKTPRSFGTDEMLSASEIHLIEMIGDYEENCSVTELAKSRGITKGAVSQCLKKLEKKGLSFKVDDPNNMSKCIVKLTSKGKTAYYAHRYWHEKIDGGFEEYCKNLEEDKISFLVEFMERVEDFLRRISQTE